MPPKGIAKDLSEFNRPEREGGERERERLVNNVVMTTCTKKD